MKGARNQWHACPFDIISFDPFRSKLKKIYIYIYPPDFQIRWTSVEKRNERKRERKVPPTERRKIETTRSENTLRPGLKPVSNMRPINRSFIWKLPYGTASRNERETTSTFQKQGKTNRSRSSTSLRSLETSPLENEFSIKRKLDRGKFLSCMSFPFDVDAFVAFLIFLSVGRVPDSWPWVAALNERHAVETLPKR